MPRPPMPNAKGGAARPALFAPACLIRPTAYPRSRRSADRPPRSVAHEQVLLTAPRRIDGHSVAWKRAQMPALAPNAGADRDLNVGTFERLSAVASSRRRLERPDASARRRRARRQRARALKMKCRTVRRAGSLRSPASDQRPKAHSLRPRAPTTTSRPGAAKGATPAPRPGAACPDHDRSGRHVRKTSRQSTVPNRRTPTTAGDETTLGRANDVPRRLFLVAGGTKCIKRKAGSGSRPRIVK